MSEVLKYRMSWLIKILLSLISIFIFQFCIVAASVNPFIVESDQHAVISETYTYDKVGSSVCVNDGRSGRVNWVISKSEAGSKSEVLIDESSAAARGVKNVIPKGKLANHIFSGKTGKLLDTPANRSLITDLTNNSKNLLGVDRYGKSWYARTLDDGTQLYVYTQGGVVKGAGINQTPLNIIKNKGLK